MFDVDLQQIVSLEQAKVAEARLRAVEREFMVTADRAGSRVERVMEVQRPGGVVGLVFPLIAMVLIRPDVAKGLARLKSNLEGRA